jgi:FkbM family methyltransferase
MTEYFKNIDFSQFTSIKFDIGLSYNAPNSNQWLENDDTGKLLVLGFEPDPESVRCIQNKNIKKRHPSHDTPIKDKYINSQFFVIPVALSNVNEPKMMDFYSMEKDVGTSSLYSPNSILGNISIVRKVPVYPLKYFIENIPWNHFSHIDYIKIDAQGSDLDIIKSAGVLLKEKVVYITAEPEHSQYNNCEHNTLSNIEQYLVDNGFIRIKHPNTTDPTFVNRIFLDIAKDIFISQTS